MSTRPSRTASPGPQKATGSGESASTAAEPKSSGGGGAAEGAAEYVERALETAGGAGRFQYLYVVALGLCWSYGAQLSYAGLFAGGAAQALPAGCGAGSGDGGCAAIEVNCSLPEEARQFANARESYVAEFGLVCDRAGHVPLLQTLFFFGFMFGVLLWGMVSDAFGRRVGLFAPLLLQQLGMLGQCIAQDFTMFAAARVFTGFGNAGFGLTSYVWTSEMLGMELRSVMAWSPSVFFALGQVALSPVGYLLPQWRMMMWFEFLLGCGFFSYLFILRESPKWLATQGRLADARVVLCACAAANGRPVPPELPEGCADGAKQPGSDEAVAAGSRPGMLQLLDKRLFGRFMAMCFLWFSTSLGFYGLSLNAASLPLNIYWANVVGGLISIPSYMASSVLIESPRCGRRGAVAGGFLGTGLCLLLSCIGGEVLLVVLYYVASGFVSLAFAVIYVWASELFPTDIKGVSLGLQSLCARVGAMTAPFVAALGDEAHPTLPLVAFATPCLVSGLLALTLPETRGRPLPGSLEDMGKEKQT